MKICKWCGKELIYDKEVEMYYCNTDGCPTEGVMISEEKLVRWE